MINEIMTLKEVEKFLSVSYATVRRMRLRGDLKAYRFSGRLYFKRSEIVASITANPIPVTTVQANAKDVPQAA